jgi:rubrerythrin
MKTPVETPMEEIVKLKLGDLGILGLCAEIEGKCAELYRRFAVIHADRHELASLWLKTANEEENHAEHFKLAIRLRGTGMGGVKTNLSSVTTILEKIGNCLTKIQTARPSPTETLTFAIQLEENLSEYHMDSIVDYADVEMAKPFTAMAKCDRGHVEMLKAALEDHQRLSA